MTDLGIRLATKEDRAPKKKDIGENQQKDNVRSSKFTMYNYCTKFDFRGATMRPISPYGMFFKEATSLDWFDSGGSADGRTCLRLKNLMFVMAHDALF